MKKPDISELTSEYIINKLSENTYSLIENMTHISGENKYYEALIQFFPKDKKATHIVISAKPKNAKYLPIKLYTDGEGFIDTSMMSGIPVTDQNNNITELIDIAKKSVLALQQFYYDEIIKNYEIE